MLLRLAVRIPRLADKVILENASRAGSRTCVGYLALSYWVVPVLTVIWLRQLPRNASIASETHSHSFLPRSFSSK